MELVERNRKNPPVDKYTEKHHIVPKGWFRRNKIEIDNSGENVVRLNVKDHLKAHLLLFYFFREVKDFDMYQSSLGAMHVMTSQSRSQLQKCIDQFGDFPKEVYDELYRIRSEAYKDRRKYSQEYIEECFRIYSSYDDPDKGMEEVLKQTGFKYKNRATLMTQFKKYIDKDRYEEVKKRNVDWYWNVGQYVERYGSVEKYEEIVKTKKEKYRKEVEERRIARNIEEKKRKDEKREKYRRLFEMYKKYGSLYVHEKLNCKSSVRFLNSCRELGLDVQSKKCSGKALEIMMNGEVHGLLEWCRILGVGMNEYALMTKVHKRAGVSYEDLFEWRDAGVLEQRCKTAMSGCEDDGGVLKHDALLLVVSRMLDCSYCRICDMYDAGMTPDGISAELVGKHLFAEDLG